MSVSANLRQQLLRQLELTWHGRGHFRWRWPTYCCVECWIGSGGRSNAVKVSWLMLSAARSANEMLLSHSVRERFTLRIMLIQSSTFSSSPLSAILSLPICWAHSNRWQWQLSNHSTLNFIFNNSWIVFVCCFFAGEFKVKAWIYLQR